MKSPDDADGTTLFMAIMTVFIILSQQLWRWWRWEICYSNHPDRHWDIGETVYQTSWIFSVSIMFLSLSYPLLPPPPSPPKDSPRVRWYSKAPSDRWRISQATTSVGSVGQWPDSDNNRQGQHLRDNKNCKKCKQINLLTAHSSQCHRRFREFNIIMIFWSALQYKINLRLLTYI